MEGITARTCQPAVRHVAAVERAFAVIDALADGQELGTNEIARRTGINASTVSRLLATLTAARFVEHVSESGRYRLSLRLPRARECGARAPRPALAGPSASAHARAGDGRDGDAFCSGRARRRDGRLRPRVV